MARYNIHNKELALKMGVRPATVSSLRQREEMPRLSGEQIERLLEALSDLSETKVRFADLYEEIDKEER